MKSGQRKGGKQSAPKKRKAASALADAAGLRAVKALAAKRNGTAEAEDDGDELQEGGAEQEEEEEEEEQGEESGEIEEQESQEAETQMEPYIKKRTRSKVLIVALPLNPRVCPDVIRESARSARQILKWVVSGIFKPKGPKPMLPTSSESFCHGSLLNTDWRLSPFHFLKCNK